MRFLKTKNQLIIQASRLPKNQSWRFVRPVPTNALINYQPHPKETRPTAQKTLKTKHTNLSPLVFGIRCCVDIIRLWCFVLDACIGRWEAYEAKTCSFVNPTGVCIRVM